MNGLMLAEITEKMLTVPQLWLFGLFLSLPFLLLAFRIRGRTGGILAVCLAGLFSGLWGYRAVDEAFDEGFFSEAIREDLGSEWMAHSIASSFVPLILTAMVVVLRRPWS